jgi:hypothetical protein
LQELDRVRVKYLGRGERDQDADLIIQTGFAVTVPLVDALNRRKPFLIMEAPYWRPDREFVMHNSSWGYNGLNGGAFRHAAPAQSRPKPELQPMKEVGRTVIFGQKPTDHSIDRDHIDWLLDKQRQYPTAEIRHHPLMVNGRQEALDDVFDRCYRAVTYSSTVGCEALIAGCHSEPESPLSMAYAVEDRREWLHRLSWAQFSHVEYATKDVAQYVISGYEEARERAEEGLVMVPRAKIDPQATTQRYYNEFGN